MLLLGFPFLNPILTLIAFPVMLVGSAFMAIGYTATPQNQCVGMIGFIIFLVGLF